MNPKTDKNVIVVRRDRDGMSVEFHIADAKEAVLALKNVIAATAWNLAAAGTPEEALRQQVEICVNFGISEGVARAKEEKEYEHHEN